ncbi:hypothetical protein M8J77_005441 [Diaphorina citri]|nr:hypothetical protein M8J77_005441 [Diaphorina citri]
MEFESPDVERDFPGLYASESAKKGNDSDFSDESFDSKLSKKDLLIGKRKEKKDRGYATLEGESSPDEEVDVKSPSKSKKSKPFKFSTKSKEKREKSKEKDIKEVVEKEKDSKKKEKDKSSKTKEKEKLKERKKVKSGDGSGDIAEEAPIFGVSLDLANQRCPCHDGVNLPLVVRECIDHVEAHGLTTDQVYKVSGLKSKVQQLKLMYNRREPVVLTHVDIPVVTSLLKLFLRELPEPILSSELLNKFEEVASVKDITVRENELKRLVDKLGSVNKMVLAWLLPHLNHVSQQEKCNKMSSQNIASVMSPVLQMSSKLLSALLFHCESILPHVELKKYVPPLTCTSPALPDTTPAIQEELKKQDSLLSQLHAEMNAGFVSKQREEQLWEVQRMITQLKRKLRVLEKGTSSQRSIEESTEDSEFTLNLNLQQVKQDPISTDAKPESADKDKKSAEDKTPPTAEATEVIIEKVPSEDGKTSVDQKAVNEVTVESARVAVNSVQSAEPVSVTSASPPGSIQSSVSICSERNERSLADEDDSGSIVSEGDFILKGLKLESTELLNLANFLQEAILDEKLKIAALQQKILSHHNFNNNIESLSIPLTLNDNADPTSEIVKESMRLEIRKENLIRSIIEEREAILDLKVQILMKQGGSIPA